ncbi:LysR family transcriptional regulator [Halomonas sp. BC04]|uniref:LysR family transcriptional regulator n=1 Tax=Halomonas sp. BC04 TaxID=1403540 RepID=UPI0005BD988E|nr:LysR family transcriptional regulator [Halomonas sp. BC04]
MLDLLLLRSFVTIIEEGSFTAAANRLHLTQPAISGHLRRLESQLGKPLLQRTTRSFQLTPEGESLLSYARAMLALNRDALAQLTSSSFHGCLRLGVAEDLANERLMTTLKRFMKRHPLADVEVRVGIPSDLLTSMRQGHLDMVLGAQCVEQEAGICLWREPLVWAWAEGESCELPSPLPLALFPEPCPYREIALAELAMAGIAQHTAMLCMSGAGMLAAATSGFAIAPMPVSQLAPGLVALSPEHGLPSLPDVEVRLVSAASNDEQGLLAALTDALVTELAPVWRAETA